MTHGAGTTGEPPPGLTAGASRLAEAPTLGLAVKEELVEAAASFLRLDIVAVIRRDTDGQYVVRAGSPPLLVGMRLHPAEGLDAAIEAGRTLLAEPPARALLEMLGPGQAHPDGRALVVPITWDEHAVGAFIAVGHERDWPPSDPTTRLVETFARVVALEIGLSAERETAHDARMRMSGLVETGLALASELDVEELLAQLVDAARTILGARYAALGVLDEERSGLARFITSGLTPEERTAIGALPQGRGILGALIRDPRPLRRSRMSDDPRSVGFPPNHPPMKSFLGVPVVLRGEVYGNLYVTEKVSGEFSPEDEQLAQALAAQAAVAIENARRYQSERARAEELVRIQQVGDVAREVGEGLLEALDLSQLLALVARRVRRLLDAQTVAVAVRDDDGLRVRHAHGVHSLQLELLPPAEDVEALHVAIRDALRDASIEAIPLAEEEELLGALIAVGVAPFDDMARALMRSVAGQTVIALRVARRGAERLEGVRASAAERVAEAEARVDVEAQRRALEAQEGERARLARELHDETGQLLTGVRLRLAVLADHVTDEAGRAQLAELRALVAEAGDNVRRLLTELRPGRIREQGLAAALEEAGQRLREAHGVQCEVNIAQLPDQLPDEVQIALFRVVQEALTNVARHAQATCASVVVAAREERIRVVVEDDGKGFDASVPSDRLGLAGIRERVELLGGELRIESSPGAGAAVIVDLALRAD
jgi:signal transduction histidine kinase